MIDEEKVEITLRPVRKIVIFQCMEFSSEEFFQRVELLATGGEPVILNWAEGIVFIGMPYHPDCGEIVERTLKGTVYWSSVQFSSMPKYQPIKKVGYSKILIIDQTSISHLRQLAQWLKKRAEA